MLGLILILSLLAGQLIKIPISGLSGITILDLVVLGLCLVGLFKLKFKLAKPPQYILFGFIFILIGLISLLINPLKLTLPDRLVSLSYAGRFVGYLGLGWLISQGGLPQIKKNLINILVISGVGLAILGLLQLIFIPNLYFLADSGWDPHYFRTVSTLLDPNFLGGFLTVTLLLLTLILFQKKDPIQLVIPQKWLKLCFILVYLALVTTFSRSAAIMFGIAFLSVCLIIRSKKMIILSALLGIGFGVAFLLYHQFIAAPRNIDRTQSAEFRLNDWQEGLTIFKSAPIIGVGFNSYRYALDKYQLASPGLVQSRGGSSNDSSLLFVADTTGLLGLAFYLLMLLSILKRSFIQVKSSPIWAVSLFAGLSGLIINSFFINSLFYPWELFWMVVSANQLD